jgi:hypothetical protein
MPSSPTPGNSNIATVQYLDADTQPKCYLVQRFSHGLGPLLPRVAVWDGAVSGSVWRLEHLSAVLSRLHLTATAIHITAMDMAILLTGTAGDTAILRARMGIRYTLTAMGTMGTPTLRVTHTRPYYRRYAYVR